jgi:hypothetical protein
MKLPIFGFTLIRNGEKYDYCFMESLRSLAAICEKIFIAVGDSEDNTVALLQDIPQLVVIPTVWDLSKREGGLILSEQTNIALQALKKYLQQENITDAWAIYLQGDEVFLETEYDTILEDFEKAAESGCDSLNFRYWHFWQTHHHIAINKKWYPHEVRAIRMPKNIESWGDAQGFRPCLKSYASEASIFHYGHVREQEKYQKKKADILTLYHSDQKMKKYKRREKRYDDMTEVLPYLGPHPRVMNERLLRLGGFLEFPTFPFLYILTSPSLHSEVSLLLPRIHAQDIKIVHRFWHIPFKYWRSFAFYGDSFLGDFWLPGHVPAKMRSSLARPWSRPLRFILRLSRLGIQFRSPR